MATEDNTGTKKGSVTEIHTYLHLESLACVKLNAFLHCLQVTGSFCKEITNLT